MVKKKVIIVLLILIITVSVFAYNKFSPTGNISNNFQQVEIVPLSQEQRAKVFQGFSENELTKDIPEKNPISIIFYDFSEGERIWRDVFLISEGNFLSQGEPSIQVIMHSKYILNLNGDNLCEVIREANKNGDLDFHSDHNKASLLLKYSSLLKYRDCI